MANLKNTTISDTGFFKLPSGDTAARPSSPAATQLRFNTETGKLEQFRPGLEAWIAPSNTGVIATGGDAVYDVDVEGTTYRVHVFTATGTSTFSVIQGGQADILVVAGGGSGGSGDDSGGGGAGGLISKRDYEITAQEYSITVGNGGNYPDRTSRGASENGEDSEVTGSVTGLELRALGGGRGESYSNDPPAGDGGSGGGTAANKDNAGSGLQPASQWGGFGSDGGNNRSTESNDGSGGGGAGSAGGLGGQYQGGNGLANDFSGILTYFAGGGMGGGEDASTTDHRPGLGGGADSFDQPSVPNTGGGGAAWDDNVQNSIVNSGASGIVIIRYPLRQNNPETAAGQDVKNGLVLDLDFVKPTVYSGSGSVVSDSRLNGIEGDLVNGPTYINTRTNRSAFEFNGSDQGINLGITGDQIVDPSNFTYAGWAWHVDADFDDWEIIIGSRAGEDHQIGGTSGTREFGILTSNVSSSYQNFSSNKVIADEQWHFVVSTYDNGRLKGFVDGEIEIDETTSDNAVNFVDDIGIGYEPVRDRRYWNGRIALAKIYTRALTDQEVIKLYNATRWRFGV